MEDIRVPPTAGIVTCLLVVGVLLVPYLLVEQGTAVTAYYDGGVITPLAAGLFSLVAIIVFAAGREGRTDPPLAAGAGLAFGGFSLLVCLAWAATVPASIALQLGTAQGVVATFLEVHRFLVAAAAALVAGSGVWYARALGLL